MTVRLRRQDLEVFRIQSLPEDFYYIPDFISPEEEASMLNKIPAQRWTQLTHRRLQAYPSTLTKNNTLLAAPLPAWLTTPIFQRFESLGIFKDTPHHQPNHVLINEYKPGEGIMPHEDGDAYGPVVATVSLGGSLCLDITHKPGSKEDPEFSTKDTTNGSASASRSIIPTRILQEPRSLLITTGKAYRDLMHGISPVEIDEDLNANTVANWNLLTLADEIIQAEGKIKRATRISLTYRDVLKVSSAASKVLGGFGRR